MGNELAGDDGAGIRVGRILRRLRMPAQVRVHFHHELGYGLLDTLVQADRVIIVDAAHLGLVPGTCVTLSGSEIGKLAKSPFCCHALGLPELVDLARHLDRYRAPPDIVVVAIQVNVQRGFTLGLTPEIAAALPEAVEQVLRSAGAPNQLIEAARHLAQRPAEFKPSLLEAHAG